MQNKRAKKVCLILFIPFLTSLLFFGYVILRKLSADKAITDIIWLLGVLWICFGTLISAWSGFRLMPLLASTVNADARLDNKVQNNEILSEDEEQQYTYVEMLRATLKCGLIILSIGLFIFIGLLLTR